MADWKQCRQKAEEVLQKYCIRKPFVDVFDIAQSEGIEIVYFQPQNAKEEGISGFIYEETENGNKKMYINKLDSAQRQVYTVAHELGHYFLAHKPSDYSVLLRQAIYATQKDEVEKEADCFAAELLMPKKMIEEIKKDYKLTNNDELIMSQLFGVSPRAMHNRLNNLLKFE